MSSDPHSATDARSAGRTVAVSAVIAVAAVAVVVALGVEPAGIAATGLLGALALAWALGRTRWSWLVPPAAVLGGAVAAWFVHRSVAADQDVQRAHVLATVILGSGVVVALVHTLFLSGWSRRVRVATGGAAALLVISLVVLFATGVLRFRGVTGDLLPRVEFGGERAALPSGSVPATNRDDTPPPADAADFPQCQGPERTGRLRGPVLARAWPAAGPVELWRRPVGAGWAGFAVAGRRAITLEQRDTAEVVACYDLVTGEPRWTFAAEGERYDDPVAGVGPRTTPTIVGDRVWVAGATGLVHALDLTTGAPLWSVDLRERFGAPVPEWGFAGSPLHHDGLVIVPAGGDGAALVALDADDGTTRWQAGTGPVHWSSPRLVTLAGAPQVLHFREALAAHAIDTGEVLWEHPWQQRFPRVAMPAPVGDDRLLVSSGYGIGAELVTVRREGDTFAARAEWHRLTLKAKFANFVVHADHAFGFDDGRLACIRVADGRRRWKERGTGHGQLLLVDDLLLVTTETGDVLLGEADPERWNELARFAALDHDTWNPPAVAGAYLLVRSDREAACFRLPLREGGGGK